MDYIFYFGTFHANYRMKCPNKSEGFPWLTVSDAYFEEVQGKEHLPMKAPPHLSKRAVEKASGSQKVTLS